MRKPTVKNKYKLTMKDCKHLVVKDRSKICEPLFWRNDVIKAWCASGSTAKNFYKYGEDSSSSFWIGVYDEDAKAYANKVRVEFDAYGGMCSYKFNKFFDYSEIECEDDLRVQEIFLERINMLIDEGVLEVKR